MALLPTRQDDLVEQPLALLSRRGLETREANALEARRRHDNGAFVALSQDGRVRAPSRAALLRDAPKGARAYPKRDEWSRCVHVEEQPGVSAFYVEEPPSIPTTRHPWMRAKWGARGRHYDGRSHRYRMAQGASGTRRHLA